MRKGVKELILNGKGVKVLILYREGGQGLILNEEGGQDAHTHFLNVGCMQNLTSELLRNYCCFNLCSHSRCGAATQYDNM